MSKPTRLPREPTDLMATPGALQAEMGFIRDAELVCALAEMGLLTRSETERVYRELVAEYEPIYQPREYSEMTG